MNRRLYVKVNYLQSLSVKPYLCVNCCRGAITAWALDGNQWNKIFCTTHADLLTQEPVNQIKNSVCNQHILQMTGIYESYGGNYV